MSVTCLEDLSNELLYEIFDYCQMIDIYDELAILNSRFQQLLVRSSLPIHLDFNVMSKEIFQHRFRTILIGQQCRIVSLRLSDHFQVGYLVASSMLNSAFVNLQRLTIENIRTEQITDILVACASLPRLFSLIVTFIEQVTSPNRILNLILNLSMLKYCRISFESYNNNADVLLNTNRCSPIEHLIIDARYNIDNLADLLTYLPHVKRLSCRISTVDSQMMRISTVAETLINICLIFDKVSIDEFEWFISSFSHQLRILSISTSNDLDCLNADRWQQLISSRMPCLEQFIFQHRTIADNSLFNYEHYHLLMNRFNSSFFSDRHWFFMHDFVTTEDDRIIILFYTTRPYRY
jgi:hypothetical protein